MLKSVIDIRVEWHDFSMIMKSVFGIYLNVVNIEVINDTWMMSSGQYESTGYMRMIHEQKWTESDEMIKRLLNIVLHVLCALHTT